MFFLLWILYAIKNIWKRFFRFKKPGNFQKIMFLNPKFGIIFSFIVNYLKIVFVLHSTTLGYKKSNLDQNMKKINQNNDIYKLYKKVVFRNLFFWSTRGSFFLIFLHKCWSLGNNTTHIKAMTLANYLWLLKKWSF